MRTRALAPAVEVGLCFLLAAGAAAARAGDWPQWGGGPGRNMASHERDLPDSFDPAVPQTAPAEPPATLPSPGRNVKWVFPTGVRTNGSPVVVSVSGRTHTAVSPASTRPTSNERCRVRLTITSAPSPPTARANAWFACVAPPVEKRQTSAPHKRAARSCASASPPADNFMLSNPP